MMFSFPNVISEVFWKQCDTVRRTMKGRWTNSQSQLHELITPPSSVSTHAPKGQGQNPWDTLEVKLKAFWSRTGFKK